MKKLVILLLVLVLTSPLALASETKNVVVGREVVATIEDSETKYYHQDRLGSTRLSSDSNGEVVDEYRSLPFGENVVESESRYEFTGKERDSSGLDYFGARYYDGSIGRFTGVDPVVSNNPYSYVDNNPIAYVDPDGRDGGAPTFMKSLGTITVEAENLVPLHPVHPVPLAEKLIQAKSGGFSMEGSFVVTHPTESGKYIIGQGTHRTSALLLGNGGSAELNLVRHMDYDEALADYTRWTKKTGNVFDIDEFKFGFEYAERDFKHAIRSVGHDPNVPKNMVEALNVLNMEDWYAPVGGFGAKQRLFNVMMNPKARWVAQRAIQGARWLPFAGCVVSAGCAVNALFAGDVQAAAWNVGETVDVSGVLVPMLRAEFNTPLPEQGPINYNDPAFKNGFYTASPDGTTVR